MRKKTPKTLQNYNSGTNTFAALKTIAQAVTDGMLLGTAFMSTYNTIQVGSNNNIAVSKKLIL
jgi:indole-3-glycerol phosphate synthase